MEEFGEEGGDLAGSSGSEMAALLSAWLRGTEVASFSSPIFDSSQIPLQTEASRLKNGWVGWRK